MPEKLTPITIRIPERLKEIIDKTAKTQRRSINNQVIYMLEHAADHLGLFREESVPLKKKPQA
ncbi:MAG: hypothetical protein HZB80_08695 [Deltaproteobacteria bacterium]|nr:hypothetical protein [Deltaproteobacteria bacterium]